MDDTDIEALSELNALYIQSVERSDADTFDEILASDFFCSQADGTLIDRTEFLERTKGAPPMERLSVDAVKIRVLGDVAIIHGRTAFTLGDGRSGRGRYTDVWARREGRWLAVAAHVTRLSA